MHDLVIRNARLVVGDGTAARAGDIAIRAGRIVGVGGIAAAGGEEIDAAGQVVAPGFIDAHTHDDRAVLVTPDMAAKTTQGVTTVVTGNCGIAAFPVPRAIAAPLTLLAESRDALFADAAAYRAAVEAAPPAVNVMALAGHSSLRLKTMDRVDRPATADEIARMRALLAADLSGGASGLSTGLFYPPASAAPSAEVEALLAVVADHGGLQTAHLRDEAAGLASALDEALGAARRAGAALVVSHLKCAGRAVWGQAEAILARIEQAMAVQPVGFDVYPYAASSTMLRADTVAESTRVLVSWSTPHPEVAGADLDAIARDWCCAPAEAVGRLTPAGGIYFRMQERDVRTILSHPAAMIGSDGLPHDRHPHPRLWGTFARILGHYVRDEGLFAMEEAVRRMTSLPARVFGLVDRGLLAEGFHADLVLFDPDGVIDTATFADPRRHAAGIAATIVAGRVVQRDGRPTGARPGRFLRRGRA